MSTPTVPTATDRRGMSRRLFGGFVLVAAAGVATAAAGVQGAQAAVAPGSMVLPPAPRVLLVGDSYTEGVGAVPKTEGYAYKIAGTLGWTLARDGIGGTGYVNAGPSAQGTYANRLWRHPADSYDLVVLQGGSNDQAYDSTTVAAAVNMTIRTARNRYPHAVLLLLGPASPYGSVSTDRARIAALLAKAAASYSLPLLDPIDEKWFVAGDGALCANPDNGHPSNAGHEVMAKLFIHDIRSLTGTLSF
jgi:acyl-CoA thioesterase-1